MNQYSHFNITKHTTKTSKKIIANNMSYKVVTSPLNLLEEVLPNSSTPATTVKTSNEDMPSIVAFINNDDSKKYMKLIEASQK